MIFFFFFFILLLCVLSVLPINNKWIAQMLQTDSDLEGNSTFSVLLQNSSDFKYISRKT